MAAHHGFLSASKEVVLEIQLNKLINDFLFSGVENHNAADVRNAEGLDDSRCMIANHNNSSWRMDKPSCISLKHGCNLAENVGEGPQFSCVTDMSFPIQANVPPNMADGSKCMSVIQSRVTSLPTSEEVRLDMPEQETSSCNDDQPQHTNKLKVFRLSRTNSESGSLFCFAMERRERHGMKKEEEKTTGSGKGSIKLTRIGSLPCHTKLHNETEKEVKHTCRKPPRPPRSSSMKGTCPLLSKHASADAIFVLHSASRRARLERKRKQAGSSSSSASIWALIFTFCFAMAMIGEGFWSQSSTRLAVGANINAIAAHSLTNPSTPPSALKTTTQNNLHVSSQLEKEMQMREFWISKGLDPS